MNRRRLLGVLGASAASLAGCAGRSPGADGASPTPTTCEESPTPEVRTVTSTQSSTSTTERSAWTFPHDLLVRYGAPSEPDTDRVVTVTITRPVDGDCNPVAFARKYELEEGASVAVDDPLPDDDPTPEKDGRTYRLDARLANGNAATQDVTVPDGAIPDYARYTVTVHYGEVETSLEQL